MNKQGDFTDYEDSNDLTDAYNAVTQADAWEWLKKDTTPGIDGFMFCRDPVLDKISSFMKVEHSGASMSHVMRHMEFIAKEGWYAYMSQRVKLSVLNAPT
jgi:hypothetical protein